MNATIKNIIKTNSDSFTSSKWNDIVAFNSDAKVLRQLCGDAEI